MDNNTRNPQRSADQWQAIVNQQIQSGLSGAAFCKAEGLKYQSFMNWRKKLERSGADSEALTEANFIELTRDEPASSEPHWHIVLDLAPGIQLRIAR